MKRGRKVYFNYCAQGLILCMLSGCSRTYRISRSPFRTYKQPIAQITTRWHNKEEPSYTCISSHYRRYPIFDIYNEDYADQHGLPQHIPLRDSTELIARVQLEYHMEKAIVDIQAHRDISSDFKIIQDKNFNWHACCGLLVLKFTQYPLILKLFMETPETFINPYCKGLEPITFFFMAGGSNRHIAGLTRLQNLEQVQQIIAASPVWNQIIHTPRKWFWKPSETRYITIVGRHIDKHETLMINIPSIYAIIADEIDTRETCICTAQERQTRIMQLCSDLHFIVDPHEDNYIFTKDSVTDREYITIIDTEHFPTLVGLPARDKIFKGHVAWYVYLAQKYAHDTFGRFKDERYNTLTSFQINTITI